MIGILISTFERYQRIAHFTEQQIKKQWAAHPPLYFSGLLQEGDHYLKFKSAPQDWMGVTLEAVQELRRRGLTHVYLILDDHPPMGPCHEGFLNELLPKLAIKLNAANISLLGYGQHRKTEGVKMGKEQGFLERCFIEYPWKFSLHPGLWNLEVLQLLLEERLKIYHEGARTAWNFERHQDQPGDGVLAPFLTRCFRVSGKHFLKQPDKMKRQLAQEALSRFAIDVALYFSKKRRGPLARQTLEKKELWRYGCYLGPYPLFWSGLMQQGKPHAGFEKWLCFSGRSGLQQEWNELKKWYK